MVRKQFSVHGVAVLAWLGLAACSTPPPALGPQLLLDAAAQEGDGAGLPGDATPSEVGGEADVELSDGQTADVEQGSDDAGVTDATVGPEDAAAGSDVDADPDAVAVTDVEPAPDVAPGPDVAPDVAGGPCSADAECKALGQVCDPVGHTCVVCTATAGCAAGTVCKNGTSCVAAGTCTSSKDCKAAGQVCDLKVGKCFDCVDAADCTAPATCSDHQCKVVTKCVSDNQCPGVCDKSASVCVDCVQNGDCKPAEFCASDKTCKKDTCAAGTCGAAGWFACASDGSGFAAPVACDDGSPCTVDACDPSKGGCFWTGKPDGTVCGNAGGVCSQPSTCKVGKCVAAPGGGVGCEDGNVCTNDVCDPAKGCQHAAAVGAKCSANLDGSPCTKGEIACQASGKCGEPASQSWICCGGTFGAACDGETAGWQLTGDAATVQQVGDTKSAVGGPNFLALGTLPNESNFDGSATKTLEALPAASSVLTFWLSISSEEFDQECGGTQFQDSLMLTLDGNVVFTSSVGDFCRKDVNNPPNGAKGTYPTGIYAMATPGGTFKHTPWLSFSIPLAGLTPGKTPKLVATSKSVGDTKYRTLWYLDAVKFSTGTCKAIAGGKFDCCQSGPCDVCNGATCVECLGGDCDSDGVKNAPDNCPTDVNVDQKNGDGDALGDICDTGKCVKSTCSDLLKQKCTAGSSVSGCCKSQNDCLDGDPCTMPTCSDNGLCVQTITAACTKTCKFDNDCADGNACTKDLCVDSLCKYTNTCGG